jgi:hypothetical protein
LLKGYRVGSRSLHVLEHKVRIACHRGKDGVHPGGSRSESIAPCVSPRHRCLLDEIRHRLLLDGIASGRLTGRPWRGGNRRHPLLNHLSANPVASNRGSHYLTADGGDIVSGRRKEPAESCGNFRFFLPPALPVDIIYLPLRSSRVVQVSTERIGSALEVRTASDPSSPIPDESLKRSIRIAPGHPPARAPGLVAVSFSDRHPARLPPSSANEPAIRREVPAGLRSHAGQAGLHGGKPPGKTWSHADRLRRVKRVRHLRTDHLLRPGGRALVRVNADRLTSQVATKGAARIRGLLQDILLLPLSVDPLVEVSPGLIFRERKAISHPHYLQPLTRPSLFARSALRSRGGVLVNDRLNFGGELRTCTEPQAKRGLRRLRRLWHRRRLQLWRRGFSGMHIHRKRNAG